MSKIMVKIRPYQDADAGPTGKLIAATYREYNLSFVPPDEQGAYLGPFQFADSADESRQKEIARVLQAPMVFVAENEESEIGRQQGGGRVANGVKEDGYQQDAGGDQAN